MGQLITSIKKDRPISEVTLLVYKEVESAALLLRGVKRVIAVDRKKIIATKKSPLFTDSQSANEFFRIIDPISVIEWETIINFSSDKVGTYLSSYFNANEKIGLNINLDKSHGFNNTWSLMFNELASDKRNHYFNNLELQHEMNKVDWIASNNKIKINDKNSQAVLSKFTELRKAKTSEISGPINIVGIQLRAGTEKKSISLELAREVVFSLYNSNEIIPVILVSPTEIERDFASKVVKGIGEDIISIETDFRALPSVLSYLDLLITPDTSVKHVADLVGTPMVEISCGDSPIFKQATINEDNILVRPLSGNIQDVTLDDVTFAMNTMLGLLTKFETQTNTTFYKTKRDKNRIEYIPFSGAMNVPQEINRFFGREIIHSLCNSNYETDLSIISTIFTTKEISDYRNNCKEEALFILKDLLAAIRNINSCKTDKKQIGNFIDSLDKLMAHIEKGNAMTLPLMLFRGKVDTIGKEDIDESLKQVETELFQLKSNIKMVSGFLDSLTKVENRVQKAADIRN